MFPVLNAGAEMGHEVRLLQSILVMAFVIDKKNNVMEGRPCTGKIAWSSVYSRKLGSPLISVSPHFQQVWWLSSVQFLKSSAIKDQQFFF